MKGFSRLPLTLYRIQSRLPVALRDYDSQIAQGRNSFDLKCHNGYVRPILAEGQNLKFETPNGMSLRPAGDKMIGILKAFKGNPLIYRLHEGILLPDHFILYHEHSDHYSLQTTIPIDLKEFNKRLTEFLVSFPSQTREQFFEELEDENNQDN